MSDDILNHAGDAKSDFGPGDIEKAPEPLEFTDLTMSRKDAREWARAKAEQTGGVVIVKFQGGQEVAGRELTPEEKRDANRCPACRHVAPAHNPDGTVSCKWCGWSGDPDTYVRPSLHLSNVKLAPIDQRGDDNGRE